MKSAFILTAILLLSVSCSEDDIIIETVEENRHPSVVISAPRNGSECIFGDTIHFAGTVDDPEGYRPPSHEVVWKSDIDGILGHGFSVSTCDLSSGTHLISLSAADDFGYPGSDSIAVEVAWPDRSSPEDCVRIINMVYEYGDMDNYRKALLEPDSGSDEFPEGYIWYNMEDDIYQYGEYYDYGQDTLGTAGILEHSISLTLKVSSGDWNAVSSFRGEPCVNCWKTVRGYYFDIEFDDGEHFLGDYFVQFVVGPDRDDSDRYLIYEASDIDAGGIERPLVSRGRGRVGSVHEVSWGALKSMYR